MEPAPLTDPAVLVSARLCRDAPCRRGTRGTLRECWADAAAIAYLRHLAGLASPADDPEAAGFAWHAEGEWLVLDAPVLGITVRGIDTAALADGLEDLGTFASDATPAAYAEAERTGAAFEAVLPAILLRTVMDSLADWPPGASYAAAPTDGHGAATRASDGADLLREAQATTEVQDHRGIIPIRRPPRPS